MYKSNGLKLGILPALSSLLPGEKAQQSLLEWSQPTASTE
jgi:hypothetical protein